jgi:acyl-CoA synthetase (AMP-forming)/AMP-acid ligase II
MVKCSGFRIELLEIEGVLYDNEGVEEAVAAAIHESRTDRTILCAVLKMKKGSRFSVTEIKGFLSEKLPKYMIPEVIKSIDNMPKNTNGKVDRQRVSMWLSSDL